MNYDAYETVIGLEVHAQLLTVTKLFTGDSTTFGAAPNTHISPVTLAYPGTLPVLNRQAVAFAVRMGIACDSEIETVNYFARKNYFYPDLPKGYQISQHTTPVCKGGLVTIRVGETIRQVALNRIHLEEDAGKSIHDQEDPFTSVDFNRAGVPLIEIVTEPCLSSAEEAHVFLTVLRRMLRYLEICDGNMEEGSMRCDANVSVRKKGVQTLGTKVEIKNLNSIRNVKRAIEYESRRMMEDLENGIPILQQTRSFDALKGSSFPMRSKEEANDYRYFPDPDLPPFHLTPAYLEKIKFSLPAMPETLIKKYTHQFQLSVYDAEVLTDDRETAAFFEALVAETAAYKAAANWMLGPVKSYLNEQAISIRDFPIAPAMLAECIELVESGKIGFSTASSRLLPAMMQNPNETPAVLAQRLNLLQTDDQEEIRAWVAEALARMPEKVKEYKNGKKGLIGLFVGEVKKISKGKADPKRTSELLFESLEK